MIGFSDAAFSAIYSLGAAVSLVAALGVGVLTDRTGRRRNAVRLAATANLLGALLMVLFASRGAYLVTHLLCLPLGASLFGQLFALARLAAGHLPPQQRDATLTALRAGFSLTFVLTLSAWAWVFRDGSAPLLAVYGVLALVAGLQAAVFWLAWPADGRTRWQDKGSGLAPRAALAELTAPRILGRILLLGGLHSAITCYMMTSGLILVAQPDRDTSDVALFAGIIALLEVPVMLTAGRWLNRWGKTGTILRGSLVYAAFLLVMPLAAPGPLVWLTTLPAAIGAGLLLSVPLLYLQDLMADRPGAGGALIGVVMLCGQVLGAALFALGTWAGGYGTVTTLSAATLTLAALTLSRLDARTTG